MEYTGCCLFIRSLTECHFDFVFYRVAHALTDGPIPMEEIRIPLTDYIVDSLRDIPEHKSLATNWSAMMLALQDCEYEPSTKRDKVEERIEIARERVMVRMLSRAAQAEIQSVAPEFLQIGIDPEFTGVCLLRCQSRQNISWKDSTRSEVDVYSTNMVSSNQNRILKGRAIEKSSVLSQAFDSSHYQSSGAIPIAWLNIYFWLTIGGDHVDQLDDHVSMAE